MDASSNLTILQANFDACADSVYQALFPRKKGSLGGQAWLQGNKFK